MVGGSCTLQELPPNHSLNIYWRWKFLLFWNNRTCTANKCHARQPYVIRVPGHSNQRGASTAPQKVLDTVVLKISCRPLSAPAMRGAKQARWQDPALQTGLTALEIPSCFLPAVSLEEPLCIWKPLLIYLPAGNSVAWFPGLQWNEANLLSHPACKIYLSFAKEKLW